MTERRKVSRRWVAVAALIVLSGSLLLWWNERESGTKAPSPAAQPAKLVEVKVEPKVEVVGRVVDDLGAPIKGADVQARAAEGSEPLSTARSNDKGEFLLHLAAGSYAVEARVAHHELAVLPSVAVPAAEALSVVLQRTSTLRGQVVDAEGKAVASATVTIAGSGIWPPRTLQTDGAGRFTLTPVPSGIYEVRATRGTFTSTPEEGVLLEPASERVLTLRLQPGADLRGRVFDAEHGTALLGASVMVSEDALSAVPISVSTDAEGGFAVHGLRHLPHRLWVHAEGYADLSGIEREPSDEVQSFGLRRAGVISGIVHDEQERPLAGVELEISGKTDTGEPLRVSAMPSDARAALAPAASATLPKAGDNLGVTAGPVPRVPLIAGVQPEALAAATFSPSFSTDAAGRFRIEGVPPGKVRVVGRRMGYAPVDSQLRALASGQELSLTLAMTRGGTLRGRVLDARGFPVPFTRVQLEVEAERDARVTLSGTDGSFEFAAVLGRSVVSALPTDKPQVREELSPLHSQEERTIELRLSGESHIVTGRVLDARGFPIEAAMVRVEVQNARSPLSLSATSAADGTFSVSGLPAPPYAIEAQHPQYAPTQLRGVKPVERQLLKIELRPGAQLKGIILDELRSEPIAGASIELRAARSSERSSTRTDALGKFEFHNLTSGKYDVLIEQTAFVSARAPVTLNEGAEVELPALKLRAAGSVSGSVVDRLGAPVWNAEVAFGAPPAWDRATRTDHAGRFRATGIEPGERTASARHAKAGSSEAPVPVRVYPKQESPGLVLRLPGSRE